MQPVTKGFFLNWISGLALVWGATFSIGNFIFGNWKTGLGLVGFGWIWFKNIALIDEAPTE